MNKYTTQGIVLTRVDFGEADRIITFITPEHGKVTAMAKGVRKTKSKLAGGIELFSVSDLTLLIGRGDIQTLMSSRLDTHFGQIVKDLAATQAAFDFIKLINKATEDQPEPAYFNLLRQSLESLNDSTIQPQISAMWANAQLLKLAGHMPDLQNDLSGAKLAASKNYDFHLDNMRFATSMHDQGLFRVNDIKFLRVVFAAASPKVVQRVGDCDDLAENLKPLIQSMLKTYFRI